MLTYLSLYALPFAALVRHVIAQWFKTARFRLALNRTRPVDRESIIRACTEFELGQKARWSGPGGSPRRQCRADEN
ncbi:hypothetical protein GCM10022247_36060 [Allokutzneria multivorans]|uniref:Uncharacterized protein n=1 Tax=Allokutzneria multivorans TaxID=1142134 RepID=A0ABP7SEG2_9PSEU